MIELLRTRRAVAVIAFLCGAVLASGLASAATTSSLVDAKGQLHACAGKFGGNVRFVKAAANCRPNETVVSWNQQGPKGERGERGERGVGPRTAAGGTRTLTGSAGFPGKTGVRPGRG